jgi:signal transduction histidine kinase
MTAQLPITALQTNDEAGSPASALYGRIERLALAAGALVMLAVVAASVLIAGRTDRDLSDATRAQDTRSLAVDTLEAVISAETGQRGYLLTGRRDYLLPYTQAAARVPALLGQLDQSLRRGGTDPAWRTRLQAAITDKMQELGETIRLEQAGRHAEALALVQTDRGRHDMDVARGLADQLSATQRAAVATDLSRSRDGTRLLVAVDSGALLLLILLSAVVGRRLNATVRALTGSQQALREANTALQTGRDQLEEAVARRTAELTEANDEIQRFAYIVSHDLRAPLLNIIGFTGELQDATNRLNRFVSDNLEPAGIEVPPEVREASRQDLPEAIRFIQTSTTKMDRLITAILRLSREGRRVLTPERLDMQALLGSILDSVRHQADAAGAALILGPVPSLIGDRLAIEQIFSNLVENALKYLAPGRPGRIELSGLRQGRMVRYEVRDNGRGIAARDRERVFELFRRAGPQNTTGEGIGLAHVRALLRRLGGTVDCESVPDVGSTFVVRLPAEMAHGGAVTE